MYFVAANRSLSRSRYQWCVATRVKINTKLDTIHRTLASKSDVGTDAVDECSNSTQRPVQVAVAVSGDINLNSVKNQWSLSARMRQVSSCGSLCPMD